VVSQQRQAIELEFAAVVVVVGALLEFAVEEFAKFAGVAGLVEMLDFARRYKYFRSYFVDVVACFAWVEFVSQVASCSFALAFQVASKSVDVEQECRQEFVVVATANVGSVRAKSLQIKIDN
jgi:hypothetical protein